MNIAEVSKLQEMSPDTLRYYERIGLIPPIERKKGGIRDYNENDLKWIQFAKCMRAAGLPIEALIDYLRMFREGDATIEARKNLLLEQRDLLEERLKDMQSTLERLNGKIENYDNQLAEKQQEMLEGRKNTEE